MNLTVRRASAALAITAAVSAVTACSQASDLSPAIAPTSADGEPSATPFPSYPDGEYGARGWYGSLPSHHDVTLTVANGVVTDLSITTPAEDDTSLGYQQRFAAALPDAVIGHPLADIDIDRLAGASGCSEGFMKAVDAIRRAARQSAEG